MWHVAIFSFHTFSANCDSVLWCVATWSFGERGVSRLMSYERIPVPRVTERHGKLCVRFMAFYRTQNVTFNVVFQFLLRTLYIEHRPHTSISSH